MSSNQIISTDLIIPHLEAGGWQEIIQALGGKLQEQGYVKDSYVPAVIQREKAFPTGLPLGEINVAIPHTDVEHVNRPAIAVATLARPVSFKNMGDPESVLDIRVVFMLAMKEPHAQVGLLQNLVENFQNPEVLKSLLQASDAEEIKNLLEQRLALKEVG